MARVVVAISGASGVILAHKTIGLLLQLGHNVDVIMSRDSVMTVLEEMGEAYASPQKFVASFNGVPNLTLHQIHDFGSPLASGSYRFDACIVIPCSMATLAAIAMGLSDNLIRRVADVTLKEKRKLVIVPRETPLHEIHLENMLKLSRIGATIFPPQPAWYLHPESVDAMENSICQRVLDQIGIQVDIAPRWEGIMRSGRSATP